MGMDEIYKGAPFFMTPEQIKKMKDEDETNHRCALIENEKPRAKRTRASGPPRNAKRAKNTKRIRTLNLFLSEPGYPVHCELPPAEMPDLPLSDDDLKLLMNPMFRVAGRSHLEF